jgi:Flp pilus assembly CpaE family ATPase
VRFIRSGGYKNQLKGFASTFDSQKQELTYLLIIQTSATVNKMDNTLEGVSQKVDMLVAFLDVQSPKEREASALVESHGGESLVVKDDEALDEIAKRLNQEYTTNMRYALQTDLDVILSANQ